MKNKKLYRDTEHAKLAGVCAGIAAYLGTEVWLVRLLTISAFLFTAGFFVLIAYIAAYFILDEMPAKQQWRQSSYQKYNIKMTAWQSGVSSQQILQNVSNALDNVESDIENMEAYVTSFAFKMHKAFPNKK